MASTPIGITAAEAAAQLAQMDPVKKWDLAVQVYTQAEDPLLVLEGKSAKSFCMTAKHNGIDEGQHVVFRVSSGFYGEGKRGTELFEADGDYEKKKYLNYSVIFGPHRHGSSYQRGVAVKNAIEHDLKSGTTEEQARWMGREQWHQAAMTIRERTPSVNRMWVGSSLENLKSTDTYDRDTVVVANGAMKRFGGGLANAGPLYYGRGSHQVMMSTVALAPTPAITRLKLDPAYQTAVQTAAMRAKDNPWFTGEIVELDGCNIREVYAPYHDGDGPIGSPFNPEAILGVEILAGTTTFDMSFGENTTGILYSKFFPGYNYEFTEDDTLAVPAITLYGSPSYIHGAAGTTENIASGGEHYVIVINPESPGFMSDGTTPYVPGAIGFYAYTIGNDGHDLTISRRLAAAASGIAVTTLGSSTAPGYANSVTWGAGTYGGRTLTDLHPVGSLVLPCSIKGVSYGYVAHLAGGGLMRAYGSVVNQRDEERANGKFVTRSYIESDWGHRVRINRRGAAPGVMLVGCALSDPALAPRLPQVTT